MGLQISFFFCEKKWKNDIRKKDSPCSEGSCGREEFSGNADQVGRIKNIQFTLSFILIVKN